MKRQEQLQLFVTRHLMHNPQVTRSELIEATGKRPATLYDAIHALEEMGILQEPERDGKRTGRKASPIMLRSDFANFLGLHLDVDAVHAVLCDARGRTLASISGSLETGSQESIKGSLLETVDTLQHEVTSQEWARLAAVGFADPAMVDREHGISIRAVNVEGWENVKTREWLEEALDIPAFLQGEMTARAYAERLVEGPADDKTSSFHMGIGRGIGGAFLMGLTPFSGASHCSMEVGHIIVRPNGEMCQCGNRGCLEALAGEQGLSHRVDELRRRGVRSALTDTGFCMEHLVQCIESQDKAAIMLAIEVAGDIGTALANVVMLLNPRVISMSGTLFAAETTVVPAIRQALSLRCLPQALQELTLRVSQLDNRAPALGAALMARSETIPQFAIGKRKKTAVA